MPLITPQREASRRLPAETCPAIEDAAELIGDPEIVAWLQRHYAARSNHHVPIVRPYGRDALATFHEGLLESIDGAPALILADGRGWIATRGVLTRLVTDIDFTTARRQHGHESKLPLWLGIIAVIAFTAVRSLWL